MCWPLTLCVDLWIYVLTFDFMCWPLNVCVDLWMYVLTFDFMCWPLNLCWPSNLCVDLWIYVLTFKLMCWPLNLCVELTCKISALRNNAVQNDRLTFNLLSSWETIYIAVHMDPLNSSAGTGNSCFRFNRLPNMWYAWR